MKQNEIKINYRTGKVAILANKKEILDYLEKGYNHAFIHGTLKKAGKIDVSYQYFNRFVKSKEFSNLKSPAFANKPTINNNSSKQIAPRISNSDKSAKQALRDIQSNPNKTSIYD